MELDPVSLLALMDKVPLIGHALGLVATYTVPVCGVLTAVLGLWHGLVLLLMALAKVPGLEKLAPIAEKLKVVDDGADSVWKKYVLPLMDRLSMLPMPKKKA